MIQDQALWLPAAQPTDRPRNATPQCRITWLPMADDGDGAGEDDVTILQLRHVLGLGEFKNAVQNVQSHGSMAQDMGPFYPRGRYVSTSAFETAVPCQIEKR